MVRLIDANSLKDELDKSAKTNFTWFDVMDFIDAMPTITDTDVIKIVPTQKANTDFHVELCKYPTDEDWMMAKECTLVTVGKQATKPPTEEFKHKILNARHSPIRVLQFVFYLELPSWVATHLARHVHAQPFIRSQRNDRQNEYDRNAARQDTQVSMRWALNAEELMNVANKRLCNLASPETRAVVQEMCRQVVEKCPEFEGLLVPHCEYYGKCHEMYPCGKMNKN